MSNSNGEGSIGRWTRNGKDAGYKGAISYLDADGNRKRYFAYGRTRKDVRDKLDDARRRLEQGAPVRDASVTIGAWMKHWRTTVLAAAAVKPATRNVYLRLSRTHLEPEPFGGIRLDKLKPSDIDALMVELRSRTKPGPGDVAVRALSDNTLRLIFVVLRRALDAAVRDGLLARNPAERVDAPRVERRDAHYLTVPETQRLLAAAKGSRYYPVLAVLAATGLRRGEALALTWDAVDLDAGTARVTATVGAVGAELLFSTPKTARSRRTVPLPPSVVALLKKHRKTQAAERLRAGDQWQVSDLVFTTALGRPVDGRRILAAVKAAAKTAGLDGVKVHTLRHSAAVAWLENGTHIRAAADLLGHSSVQVTGDVYAHSSDQVNRAAVDALGAVLDL